MAAPKDTTWGSEVNSYSRLGLYIDVTENSATTYEIDVEVWYWSKYSTNDTTNILYFDNLSKKGSATTEAAKNLTVKNSSDSGGWSYDNQIKLKTYNYSYEKATTTSTRYIYAKLSGIQVANSKDITVSTPLTIPRIGYTKCGAPIPHFSKNNVSVGESLLLTLDEGVDGLENPVTGYELQYSLSNGLSFSEWNELSTFTKADEAAVDYTTDLSSLITTPNQYLAIRTKSIGTEPGYDSSWYVSTCRINDLSDIRIYRNGQWIDYTFMSKYEDKSDIYDYTVYIKRNGRFEKVNENIV